MSEIGQMLTALVEAIEQGRYGNAVYGAVVLLNEDSGVSVIGFGNGGPHDAGLLIAKTASLVAENSDKLSRNQAQSDSEPST